MKINSLRYKLLKTWDPSMDDLRKSSDEYHVDESELKDEKAPSSLAEHHGKKVFVYYNLHKNVWSVKHKGKVIAHAHHVAIKNPQFKVSEAGRQRVLSEKRKNVHAGVAGELDALHTDFHHTEGREAVSYNPYRKPEAPGHFYNVNSDKPVHAAEHAVMRVEHHADDKGQMKPKGRVYAKGAVE